MYIACDTEIIARRRRDLSGQEAGWIALLSPIECPGLHTDVQDRMMMAGGEFTGIYTENRKRYSRMKSESGVQVIQYDGGWNNDFKGHLKRYRLKPFTGSLKYPLMIGMTERFSRSLEDHKSGF